MRGAGPVLLLPDGGGRQRAALVGILRTGLERSDILILSGGLGPTQDDLTKETAAQVCGRKLTEDARSLSRIEEYFRERGLKMTDNNRKQALVPEGALVVDNDNGTAPGLILEKDGKRIILLPGPPNELIPMFEKKIAPYLLSLDPDGPSVIYSRTVKICGLGESGVEAMITDLEALSQPYGGPLCQNGRGASSRDRPRGGGKGSQKAGEAGGEGAGKTVRPFGHIPPKTR